MSAEGMRPDPLHEDALSAHLDGELDATARAEVEARLAESAEWRAILDELRETRGALRALPPVEAAPAFWQRVLGNDQILDQEIVDLAAARRAKHRRAPWKLAVAGAAAAVVIVVGVAAIPQRDKVNPAVASFTDAHATRSSLNDDVVSHLASVGIPGFGR
jgi:anti-sigma factor RsiW